MKYFLFINYNSGLKHNSIYNNFYDLYESVLQLIEEENLEIIQENILSLHNLQNHLKDEDDYLGILSNGTWFHIQECPVFATEKHRLFILCGQEKCNIFRKNNILQFDEIKDEIIIYEFNSGESLSEFMTSIDTEIEEEYIILTENQVDYIMQNSPSNQ